MFGYFLGGIQTSQTGGQEYFPLRRKRVLFALKSKGSLTGLIFLQVVALERRLQEAYLS